MKEIKLFMEEYKKSVNYMQIIKFFSVITVITCIVLYKHYTSEIKIGSYNNDNFTPGNSAYKYSKGFFEDLYERLYLMQDYLITFAIFGVGVLIMIKSNREWDRQWSANFQQGRKAPTEEEEEEKESSEKQKRGLSVVDEVEENSLEESLS